jgi:uncharacterized membrane protein
MLGRLRVKALAAFSAISASFWFIPALVSAAGAGLAWLTIDLEGIEAIARYTPRAFTPEGARSILSTIAGAVMTVGGVVFSLTIVALSVTAQQLGPRVVLMLMRDRMTQITLGVFNATFLNALITLAVVSSQDESRFVPSVAVLSAIGLAVLSFVLVINFVHAIALHLQADAVIAHLSDDLDQAIRRVALADDDENTLSDEEIEAAARIRAEGAPVAAGASGYVQSIDFEQVARIATDADAVAAFAVAPGDFILRGRPMFYLKGGSEGCERIEVDCMQLNPRRTSAGNITFEIDALVDVALRALSPALNDPNTAVACLDHLSDALARLASHRWRSIAHCDKDGAPRVYALPRLFDEFVDKVFEPLVPAAAPSPIARAGAARVLDDLLAVAGERPSLRRWREALRTPCSTPPATPLPARPGSRSAGP